RAAVRAHLARPRHRVRHRRHRQGRSLLADRRAPPGGAARVARSGRRIRLAHDPAKLPPARRPGPAPMMTPIAGLASLREVIRRTDLKPRKSLGQNFLLDLNLTARIARAGGALAGVTVVEIGPGPGGLTRALLAEGATRVIAVERDTRAIAALDEIAARYPGRLTVVSGDALEFDPAPHLGAAAGPVRIVANLPYNIATALLVGWLSVEPWPPWYESLVLMFQREVAERIAAAPGSKSYGRLAVLAGWRTDAKILFDVSAAAFVPPPPGVSPGVRPAPRAARLRPPDPRARRRGRLRPAPKDAAPEPAHARGRSKTAAHRRRHCGDGAGRGYCRGRLRGAGAPTRRPRCRMTRLIRQSLVAYGAPLCETVVEAPTPRGTEVLVRIERCGVCHSDVHVQDGYFRLGGDKQLDISKGRALPFTLGHEIAGVVDCVGLDTSDAKPGDKVAIYPWIGCGQCIPCRHGEENNCAASRHVGVN